MKRHVVLILALAIVSFCIVGCHRHRVMTYYDDDPYYYAPSPRPIMHAPPPPPRHIHKAPPHKANIGHRPPPPPKHVGHRPPSPPKHVGHNPPPHRGNMSNARPHQGNPHAAPHRGNVGHRDMPPPGAGRPMHR